MNATYTIAASQKSAFLTLLEKSNKKSTKLGMPGLVASFGMERPVEVVTRNGRKTGHFYNVVDVTLSGVNPVLNGWRLIAVVSPLKTDDGRLMSVVTNVPGENFGDMVADPLYCDHCKLRRDRLETFIVRHEDGTTKQVARNCLKDYVGGNNCDADSIAALIGLRNKLATETERLGFVRDFFSVSFRNVIAFTIAAIRQHGWLSKREAYNNGGIATASWVARAMEFARHDDYENELARELALTHAGLTVTDMPTEADFVTADDKLQTLEVTLDRLEGEGKMNDYTTTLRTLTVAHTVNAKAMGIAVSALTFIDRENAPKNETVSNYIGEVGQKLEVRAKFINGFRCGTGAMLNSFSVGGNIVKFFDNNSGLAFTTGSEYTLKGKVKAHNEYKGRKETMMNYVKVEE